ncbi:DUF6457 domain-containing protein [Couchioplanes caeruleus]|uniref:DUF6457 domain-containing protein n=2 Tax=Couchioplanes caeruleus TaxID=56438 RepID=A0A1K0FLW6_9ACTN|nr:DUF6457 domain-containing protein [Couchioplanes caeruleus]OJF13839.1 hypothetical protein BG844_13125 [Couchioplanes caeruleus subsp. caeruleus]ROP31174.1 hypothetical protein EDD30_4065 [Couchioplanes caeruleus]
MNVLDEWIKAAVAELGLSAADVAPATDQGSSATALVLDLARDVAHNVVRPGAPISAYLMGLAVGRGADPADVAARLSELAKNWPPNDR